MPEVVHRALVQALADHNPAVGSAARMKLPMVMARFAGPDGGEVIDKGYVGQRQVLINQWTFVELRYDRPAAADLIVAGTAGRTA